MLRKLLLELRTMPKFIYFTAALAIFGLSVGLFRMIVGLGPTTNLTKAFPWGLWISFDLATVSLAAGAFVLATLVYVFQFDDLHVAMRPTLLAGLVGEVGVLFILLFDLGRWDHFYNVFLHPNFSSALMQVSWCLAAYALILVYEISPVALETSARWKWLVPTIKRFSVPLVILGGTLAMIHQSSLGTLFVILSPRLHALWSSMLLPVFFLISSLASGIALVLAGASVSYWLFGRSLKTKTMAKLSWFLPWILGFYLVIKFGELMITGDWDLLLTSGGNSALFWAEILIGAVVPIVLFAFRQARFSRFTSLIGALFIIAGTILNRFNVTWFGMAPVDGETYSPHWMEVAIILGVIAGVVTAYSLIARYLPVYEETVPYRGKSRRADSPAVGD